jgi:cell wall-associated NlpC family hydrolase
MWAYKQVGITLPHYTGSQWNSGTHVARSQLRPGDLVFFYSDLHHVGMYVGGGNMINAPQTGDVVRIVPLAGRPYAGAVRIV